MTSGMKNKKNMKEQQDLKREAERTQLADRLAFSKLCHCKCDPTPFLFPVCYSLRLFSTSVWSPPAPAANWASSESRSRPPWRWRWAWRKWCAPTALWSSPSSPPPESAAGTCPPPTFFLPPEQERGDETSGEVVDDATKLLNSNIGLQRLSDAIDNEDDINPLTWKLMCLRFVLLL